LLSAEIGVDQEKFRALFSYTSESFDNPNLPERWEETELVDSDYRGVVLENQIFRFRGLATWLSYGYVERRKAKGASGSTSIEGEVSASTQRLDFEKWLFLGLNIPLRVGGTGQILSSIRFHQSPSDSAEWLAGEFTYIPEPRSSYFLSFDIFGTGNLNAESPSFISQYANNDRVMGGFRYVF
jgi:hypothetical protein